MTASLEQQIHIERLVHAIRSDLEELMKMRLNPATAELLMGEEQNLGGAMTALQVLLSHMAGERPALRVVR